MRLERFRNPDKVMEEAGAFSGEASASSGNADVLAGESAAEEVNRFMPVARPLPHVIPAGNVWPSCRKNSSGEWIAFNLPFNFKPRSFKAKIKPSHSGK